MSVSGGHSYWQIPPLPLPLATPSSLPSSLCFPSLTDPEPALNGVPADSAATGSLLSSHAHKAATLVLTEEEKALLAAEGVSLPTDMPLTKVPAWCSQQLWCYWFVMCDFVPCSKSRST